MLFASLIIERDPLELDELPAALASWLRDAGLIAAVGLVIWGLAYLLQRPAWARHRQPSARATLFLAAASGAAVLYALFLLLLLVPPTPTSPLYAFRERWCLPTAGALALLAVLLPILLDLFGRIRWRRIWALARVSVKEARSKGILWVALIIPLIYLYADWYLVSPRLETQLSQRVKMVYFSLTVLFVLSAVLLGSFNIPNDVRNQTIQTIVTKPVERYEIVLGRFIGYALLLLAELLVLTGLSLFYVTRGLPEEAKTESYHARVPVFATQMGFSGTKGESVGREWDYRKYISGAGLQPGAPKQYAVWQFHRLPGAFADPTGPIPLEFSFDIFRTTKGDEKVQGVYCSFFLADGRWSVPEVEERAAKADAERNQRVDELNRTLPRLPGKGEAAREREHKRKEKLAEINAELAGKHGVHVAAGVVAVDYHTQSLAVPGALFKKLYADQGKGQDVTPSPAMQILVTLEKNSGPQLLGAARRDLYILAGDNSFHINFLKGSLGLWFTTCLVLGIALACSTYLSGIISMLTTVFLCGAGLFRDYITSLIAGTSAGGGPFESAYRLGNRQAPAVQLERGSTVVGILQQLDQGFLWYLRLVLKIVPDVTRYDLTAYVANGFDISWAQLLFADSLLPLLGYLVPCGILAYYLMNSREIANPT